MLSDKDAAANIAVKDLQVAKKFYEDTLGLKQAGAEGESWLSIKRQHNAQRLPIAVRRNQQGHSRNLGGRRRCRRHCARLGPRASASSITTCLT